MREALAAKNGSRGKIQQRCCHGLIASSESQRQTVLSLIRATSPVRLASAATSDVLILESGTPRWAGSSHARALTWTTNSGGKTPRAAGAGVLLKPRQALLEESLPPFPDDLPANIQEGCDLIGGESLGRQEDHLGPQDMIIRRRIFHRTPHQLASLFRRQDDPVWAFSRLGDGPPSLSPCHGPAYVASHNTSPYL